jgi:hypothetical protein
MAKFSRQEKGEKKLEWENRILKATFGLGLLATLLLLIAISTSQWVTVKYQYSVLYNETRIGRGEFYKTGHYHGLWRICRQEYVNTTSDAPYDSEYKCINSVHFVCCQQCAALVRKVATLKSG